MDREYVKNIENIIPHKEKYSKQIKAFRWMGDTFMTAVFVYDIQFFIQQFFTLSIEIISGGIYDTKKI